MSNNQALDLHHILAAPLVATIEADFNAANKFVEYVTQYGFEEVSEALTPDVALNQTGTSLGQLRMVTFWYTRRHPQTGQDEYVHIQVPALSLIPLPLLQVDNAEFNFNIQVHPEEQKKLVSQGQPGALLEGVNRVEANSEAETSTRPRFKASLPPTRGQKDDELVPTTANMKVKIQMRQADVPTGIANLMVLLNEGTSMSQHRKKEQASSAEGGVSANS